MRKRTFVVLTVAATLTATAFQLGLATVAAAAASIGPVASYVFSVGSTIAPTNTLGTGVPLAVSFTVTAEDGQHEPIPDAVIYLSYTTTSAYPGFITVPALTTVPTPMQATAQGSVAITYQSSYQFLQELGTDTVTAQDQLTATVESSTSYTRGTIGTYTPITPFRICDTRPVAPGIAHNQCNTGAGSGPLEPGVSRYLTIDGHDGLPVTGVTAVALNLTAIAPTRNTNIVAFPDDLYGGAPGRAAGSQMNVTAGSVVADMVEIKVGIDGRIEVADTLGTVNMAIDIEGYVVPSLSPLAGFFGPVEPTRICDTRAAGPGIASNQCNSRGASPIGAGATLTFNVHASGSPVPASGVSAVSFSLTAIGPTARTVLTAYPGNSTRPAASTLNAAASATMNNSVMVPVSSNGTVSIWNSTGSINVAVDIDGWFSTASGPLGEFGALPQYSPLYLCDTIYDSAVSAPPCVVSGHVLNVTVANMVAPPLTFPLPPIAAVIAVTVSGATAPTFITAYAGPITSARPTASELNVPSSYPIAMLMVVPVGPDGTINIYNAVGTFGYLGGVRVRVDFFGYYAG
jgi:hypothetical protein